MFYLSVITGDSFYMYIVDTSIVFVYIIF